jgi:hypothetical protein
MAKAARSIHFSSSDDSYRASSQVRVFSLSLENSFFSGELLTKF